MIMDKTSIRAKISKSIKAKYPGLKKLKKLPTSPQELKKLGEELLQWCFTPEALILEDFPLSKGYSPYRFRHCEDEYFIECFSFASAMLASKLKKGALRGELDAGFVAKLLPLYDQEFRELINSFRKNFEGDMKQITVVIPPIPSTDSVPERHSVQSN